MATNMVQYYINKILNNKKEWKKANEAGNEALKKAYAYQDKPYKTAGEMARTFGKTEEAKNGWGVGTAKAYNAAVDKIIPDNDTTKAYKWLENNDHKSEAKKLHSLDYDSAVRDMKDGKVGIRDYARMVGANTYGLTQEQVDNLIGYDEVTGNVTIGGQNIGTPFEVEGKSYADSDDIDSAFKNAMSKIGINKTADTQYNEALANETNAINNMVKETSKNLDRSDKYHNEYLNRFDDFTKKAYDENFMDSDWAKGIMSNFNYNGTLAGQNELANSAGTNGGNIDSYGMANAKRQQLAYTSAGMKAAADNWLQRLGLVNEALGGLRDEQSSKLQINNQSIGQFGDAADKFNNQANTVFANDETRKQNAESRSASEQERGLKDAQMYSDLTGKVSLDTLYGNPDNNPYLKQIDNDNFDFGTQIEERIRQWEETGNENLLEDARKLIYARNKKTELPQYRQYASDKYNELLETPKTAGYEYAEKDQALNSDIKDLFSYYASTNQWEKYNELAKLYPEYMGLMGEGEVAYNRPQDEYGFDYNIKDAKNKIEVQKIQDAYSDAREAQKKAEAAAEAAAKAAKSSGGTKSSGGKGNESK